METLYVFLLGVVCTACAAIGVFFVRFWRRAHDRLFLIFALAFWLMGASWALIAFLSHASLPGDESFYPIYLLRILAYACIIAGIIDKNRTAAQAPPRDS